MAGMDVIKEYLVSLGFEVDKQSYNLADKAADSIGESYKKAAGTIVVNMAKATAAVTGLVAAVVGGTATILNGLGKQEIQMEMLSRQLWTTQQQAQEFSLTLKAMGANLQQLYLSPTLMNQYRQLVAVAAQLRTPGDYNSQIQMIQSVSLQFKQMRLEAYYAMQWIGYYFIKYMAGPIKTVQQALQSINALIIKNMPDWTKHVAEVMASFVQAGVYIVEALGKVYQWMRTLLSYVPGWAKGITAALAGIGIALSLNPFGLFMAALGAVVLLLDDFMTYLHGGKSELGPFWSELMKLSDGGSKLQSTLQQLGSTLQNLGNWFQNLYKTFKDNGTIDSMTEAWQSYFKALEDVGRAIGEVLKGIGHLFGEFTDSKGQSDMQNFFQLIADMGIGAIKIIGTAIEEVASLAKIVGLALQGKWSDVGKVVKDMWTGQNLANIGIIPQNYVAGFNGSQLLPIKPSWIYSMPGSSGYGGGNTTVTLNQTNNINGSDPQATANAVQNNTQMFLMRGLRGAAQ